VPELLVDVADGVGLVTLHRPERANAITLTLGRRYVDVLAELDADPAVRVIVVTGAGSRFCGGADLALFTVDGGDFAADTLQAPELPDAALRIRKPVITAVNGAAFGIGVAYALCADIRFAAEHASFDPAFVRLGLVAEYNTAWLLERLIGLGRTAEVLLSGRRIEAAEARAIGLVHDVLPAGALLDHVLDYARAMARTCSPRAMADIKAQLWADAEQPRADALSDAWHRMVAGYRRGEVHEAFAARTEGRPPVFAPLEGRGD
jgi:enoyl-CoA hydratase/carnithine racemase